MYGSYSDFRSIKQDVWNMNTHIGQRVISSDRIEIVESSNGRTDALSLIMEAYNIYRHRLPDVDLSRLDDFIKYAKERYKADKDYEDGAPDLGRKDVSAEEEQKYCRINGIRTSPPGRCRLSLLKEATICVQQGLRSTRENPSGIEEPTN